MKPKQPAQRIGYFPEQPAASRPQGDQPRRRAARPQTAQPRSHPYQTQSVPHRSQAARAQQMGSVYQPSAPVNAHPPVRPAASHQQPAVHAARPTQSGQPARSMPPRRKTGKSNQPMLQRMVLIVCAVVFVVSAFLLIRYFVNIAITRRASAQLEEVYSAALQNTEVPTAEPTAVPTPTPTAQPQNTPARAAATPVPQPTALSASELWPSKYPSNPTLRVSTVFYELQRENPDIIGWLKIDGVLEEAVVQRDNEYYLTHNALKQKSVTGALFLDENCDLKKVPTQMLIHGHNMKEGAMFGSLKKYKVKDASFYRQHPFIDFNTIYENGRYVIFAVAEVDLRWNKGDYLPFWQDVRFSSADAFMDYVQKARDLSDYRCNVDVQPGDRLLTLSTCTGTDDNKRLILMARKLRDNENELELNMSIMSTADR